MADSEQTQETNFQLYGAIFALVLYFGVVSPWEAEISELSSRVEQKKKDAAKPARFVTAARLAREKLEKKKALFVTFLSNLPGESRPETVSLSALERFSIIVDSCKKNGLPAPDIKPLPDIENDYFQANGCAFRIVSKDERVVYRLLHTLRTHHSEPRIRSIALVTTPGVDTVTADISVSWPSFKKAGITAARSVKRTDIPVVAVENIQKWALFDPAILTKSIPKKKTPGKTGKNGSFAGNSSGKTAVSDSSAQALNTNAATESAAAPKESKPKEAAPTLKGVTLLGTISIAGLDGVIVPLGGSEKIVLAGDSLKGWTLESVSSHSARFRKGTMVSEVKLTRKSLLGEETKTTSEPEQMEKSGASILAQIPKKRELGLHAIMSSPVKVDGGRLLARKGYRRGMLVRKIDTDSLALEAGIQPGDFIYLIDENPVRTPTQLRVAASKVSRNESVAFKMLRNGSLEEIVCSN